MVSSSDHWLSVVAEMADMHFDWTRICPMVDFCCFYVFLQLFLYDACVSRECACKGKQEEMWVANVTHVGVFFNERFEREVLHVRLTDAQRDARLPNL